MLFRSFALIALAATAKGRMGRSSYALRMTGAAFAGASLRLVGYAAQGLAARGPELNAALYLLPLAATGLASAILADWPLVPASIRRLMSGPAGVPAE